MRDVFVHGTKAFALELINIVSCQATEATFSVIANLERNVTCSLKCCDVKLTRQNQWCRSVKFLQLSLKYIKPQYCKIRVHISVNISV